MQGLYSWKAAPSDFGRTFQAGTVVRALLRLRLLVLFLLPACLMQHPLITPRLILRNTGLRWFQFQLPPFLLFLHLKSRVKVGFPVSAEAEGVRTERVRCAVYSEERDHPLWALTMAVRLWALGSCVHMSHLKPWLESNLFLLYRLPPVVFTNNCCGSPSDKAGHVLNFWLELLRSGLSLNWADIARWMLYGVLLKYSMGRCLQGNRSTGTTHGR